MSYRGTHEQLCNALNEVAKRGSSTVRSICEAAASEIEHSQDDIERMRKHLLLADAIVAVMGWQRQTADTKDTIDAYTTARKSALANATKPS